MSALRMGLKDLAEMRRLRASSNLNPHRLKRLDELAQMRVDDLERFVLEAHTKCPSRAANVAPCAKCAWCELVGMPADVMPADGAGKIVRAFIK